MLSIISNLRNIIKGLGKYSKFVRIGYPFALLGSISAFVPYGLLYYVISIGLVRNYTMKDFYIVLGLMLLGVTIRAISNRILHKLQQDKGYYVYSDERLALTDHLAKLNMGYYTEGNIGKISSIVTTDISFIEGFAMQQFGLAVSSISSIIVTSLFMVIFDYRFGLLYIGMTLLGLVVLQLYTNDMDRESKGRQKNLSKLSNSVVNFVKGMQAVKAFNMQREKSTAIEEDIDVVKQGSLNFVYKSFIPGILCSLGYTIPIGVMIYFISKFNLDGTLPFGITLGFIVFSFVLFVPLSILQNSGEALGIANTCVNRYNELMKVKEQHDNTTNGFVPQKMDIEFKNVSFAYEKKEVLTDINLKIKDKTFTALVGRSGSGKTTIANLIARFWDIQNGEILFDGQNISEIATDHLLSCISMVFQKVYLFNDTIYNNIAFGDKNATKEKVIEASKKARCHDFIMKLEKGYDTVVGEGGSSLSGGEKQRISIARAILKDAPLILLDEATAGIDPDNEKFIQDAIDELVKDKTLVVIAHRLSTIQRADNIVFLESGKIIESGTHEELLKLGGKYKRQFDFYQMKV